MQKTITLTRARYWYIVACAFVGGIAAASAWRNPYHMGWRDVWIIGTVIVLSFAFSFGRLWWRRRKG